MKISDTSLRTYFSDLWVFLPYIVLYLLWWVGSWPIELLTPIFQALHCINVVVLGALLWRARLNLLRTQNIGGVVFWFAIILLVLLPGAYFEYPSDPWEHFRRLMRWQAGGAISDHPIHIRDKFSYYWGWTFLAPLSLESRRSALDLYAAFWQMVVLIQVYRLLRCFSDQRAAAFGTCVFLGFFGTNIFGLRYYGLSSTLLAYASYFQILIIILRGTPLGYSLASIAYLTAIILGNHKQEFLFVLLMTPVAILLRHGKTLPMGIQRALLKLGVVTVLAGFLGGWCVNSFLLSPSTAQHLAFFGGFPLWNSFYLTTLGVVGWLGIIAACISIALRRATPLSYFVVIPPFVLVWPPTALLVLTMFPNTYLTYRVLYAMPAALGVLIGLELLAQKLPAVQLKRALWVGAALALLFLGIKPESPWRGRLWFALHQAPEEREYQQLLPMVRWFQESWDLKHLRNCLITTDDITRSLLTFHLGFQEWATGGEKNRRGLRRDGRYLLTTDQLADLAKSRRPFCGVLVYAPEGPGGIPPSLVANLSAHWHSEETDLNWHVSDEFRAAARELEGRGWKRWQLPGGYEFFAPPKLIGLSDNG